MFYPKLGLKFHIIWVLKHWNSIRGPTQSTLQAIEPLSLIIQCPQYKAISCRGRQQHSNQKYKISLYSYPTLQFSFEVNCCTLQLCSLCLQKRITARSFLPLCFEIILNVLEFIVIESRETKITLLFNSFVTFALEKGLRNSSYKA